MQNYLIVNHSDGTTPPASAQDWGTYFQEALGAHVVDGGKPIGTGKAAVKGGEVVNDSADTTVGYYIIKADNLEEALKLVKHSPLSDKPGCEVRVYETRQM
jgi:hypothetical protein